MDHRQALILETIIKEHIKTGLPVGSNVLVEKYKLNISPATVRNEMSALEKDEFIVQPHTSAGRIPTEKAYALYLEKIKIKQAKDSDIGSLEPSLGIGDEASFKDVAKQVSQLSGNAVFWAFHKHNLYYTGISNLFQQPEFSRISIIHDISAVIDRLDETINSIIEDMEPGLHTLIGSQNPFGSIFGTIFVKYHLAGKTGMIGVLGPIRMDYEKILSLMDFINKRINK
jgi:transcriptional regulator of heat shock response